MLCCQPSASTISDSLYNAFSMVHTLILNHYLDAVALCFNDDVPSDDVKSVPSSSLPQSVRRLQLLRFWLLHFVRLIHDHFFTAVFMPFSLKFQNMLNTCDNFFQLIRGTETFIFCFVTMFARVCLLGNTKFLKIALC